MAAIDLSRQEYPAILTSLQPSQAVTLLGDRVKRVAKVNSEVADWLQERRRVEELYVQGLRKLARKQPPDEASELGIFKTPWQKMVSSTDALAASHQVLAQKIEVDVERPLREFATKNREMQAVTTIQGNLGAIAKEIDSAQEKVDKLKKKGAKASAGKVATATADVETATSSWESQAPFVFESLQAADETRLNHLRDVLTQFHTHEIDQIERCRAAAEACLNVLLNVETADEIKAFAARAVAGKAPRLEKTRSNTLTGPNLAPPPPIPSNDDAQSQRSTDFADAQDSGYIQEASHSERFSGLKRLGTVIGKRRQSTYGRATSPGRRSTKLFSGFGRSDKDVPPLPSHDESSGFAAQIREGSGLSPRELDSSPAAQRSRARRGSRDMTNGSGALSNPTSPASNDRETNGTISSDIPSLQNEVPGALLGVSEFTQSKEPQQQRDAEGFTIPSSSSNPISQAEQDAATEDSQPQFKLDIRDNPIREEGDDAQTALANVASTLRAQATPNRRQGTVRGRRDVRNTIFVPSGESPSNVLALSEGPPAATVPKPTRTTTLTSEDGMTSDAQSIHSSRSLASLANVAVKHPEMHQPGLNSSVIETVSASFESGQITKAVVIGEMALAYNHPDPTKAPAESQAIRLENFPVLEKVAPNPGFITPLPDRSGEYQVGLASIARTAVAFKYQVHLDESTVGVHVPLMLTLAWKIEANQTSVILTYALNPSFSRQGTPPQQLTLHNVSLVVHLDGGRPTACQTKPVGTFSKERGIVYWRLGDVTVTAGAPPSKLLARFSTETEAKAGNAEARWELRGSGVEEAHSDGAEAIGSNLGISQQIEGPPVSAAAPDPFADTSLLSAAANLASSSSTSLTSSLWKAVPTVRKLVHGKYVVV